MRDSLLRFAGLCIVSASLIYAARIYRADQPHGSPPPAPSPSSFQEQVAAEYANMGADEACLLQTLFDQFATSLQYDGQRTDPRVRTSLDMGQRIEALMQYRLGADSPFGDKYQSLETLVARELQERLALTRTAQPLTPQKRAAAVALFREMSAP